MFKNLFSLAARIQRNSGRLCTILGLCVTWSAPSLAQNPEHAPEPTFVRGDFSLESSFGIEALYDTNIFQSWTEIESSQVWKLTPELLLRYEPAGSRLELGYKGDYGWYDRSGDDDYTDHAMEAGAYLLLGERGGLDLVATYEDGHDERGTQYSQGVDPGSPAFPEKPDRYDTGQFLARYTHGVSRAHAYLIFEGSTEQLTYQNNRTRTRPFDRSEDHGKVTFGLRVRPKTSLELSVRARDIAYDYRRPSGVSPDSREYRYLLGVVWEATARTTGYVRVGQVEKNFDDPARPDFSGPNWEVEVRWSPRTYSHFDLGTERYADEPVDIFGDVTDTKIYSLSWSHEWNDRFGTRLAASKQDRTYRFATGDRTDKSPRYSLAVIYKMRPWLRWEAGVDQNARDSTFTPYNYDQTIARIGAWITF